MTKTDHWQYEVDNLELKQVKFGRLEFDVLNAEEKQALEDNLKNDRFGIPTPALNYKEWNQSCVDLVGTAHEDLNPCELAVLQLLRGPWLKRASAAHEYTMKDFAE